MKSDKCHQVLSCKSVSVEAEEYVFENEKKKSGGVDL